MSKKNSMLRKAGEVAQSGKCLSSKQKDLGFHPQCPHKLLGIVLHSLSTSTVEAETGRSLEFVSHNIHCY